MRGLKDILILCLVSLSILGLYAFAGNRHDRLRVNDINISFTDYSNPLISEGNVNKLLIQKDDTLKNSYTENLDLNKSEMRLDANPMIRAAEVSVDLNGKLNVLVEQRTPIARIIGKTDSYLDVDNKLMPLSSEHTVLVPIVTGFKEAYQEELYSFLMYLKADDLLEMGITQIGFDKNGSVSLRLRAHSLKVQMGELKGYEWKMPNFKAMLAKLEKDKTVDSVEKIDLRFDHQVIVVKKD
ncbi:cell division protein FtsQ/DivIB [Nonlabens antarcticus]|uniref:cell division protein FtsQ/DivIB n=1 Tax=Nonlabens antarcticus TaxID=392714 RepID=UPI001E49ACA4|nr:cell division protein FtsQ/DivIB [Nonlabens antarcticus]